MRRKRGSRTSKKFARRLRPISVVAVMMPNYLQTWGLAQNFGAQVKAFQLHEKEAWEPYVEEIRTAIAPDLGSRRHDAELPADLGAGTELRRAGEGVSAA